MIRVAGLMVECLMSFVRIYRNSQFFVHLGLEVASHRMASKETLISNSKIRKCLLVLFEI